MARIEPTRERPRAESTPDESERRDEQRPKTRPKPASSLELLPTEGSKKLVASRKSSSAAAAAAARALAPRLAAERHAEIALRGFERTTNEILTSQGRPPDAQKAKQADDTRSDTIEQLGRDLALIENPGASPRELQEMAVRRGSSVPIDAEHSPVGDDSEPGTKKSGFTSTRTEVDQSGKATAITAERSKSTTVSPKQLEIVERERTTRVTADSTSATERTRKTHVDLEKLEAKRSRTDVETKKDATGSMTRTESRTTTFAGSGIQRIDERSTRSGDHLESRRRSAGVERSAGQLGVSASVVAKKGTLSASDETKLDRGSETTTSVSGGLVSDQQGTGSYRSLSHESKRLFGSGWSTTGSAAAGVRYQVKVEPVGGSEPPRVRVTTTLTIDARAGIAGGKSWDTKGDFSVKGGASALVRASFTREFGETDAQAYVERVRANGSGGKLPEHSVLREGASQGVDAALGVLRAFGQSADTARSLKRGDSMSLTLEGGLDGGLGTTAGNASAASGFTAGVEVSGKVKRGIQLAQSLRADGKLEITATVDDERKLGGSLSGGAAGVYGKASIDKTSGQGHTVTFVLEPNDGSLRALLNDLSSATTPDDVQAIGRRYQRLLSEYTEKNVEGGGVSAGLGLGPLSLEMGQTSKLTEELTRDRDGRIIKSRIDGEYEGGGSVGAGQLRTGSREGESYAGEVDRQGRASGNFSETQRSTSLKKTLDTALDKAIEDPVGVALSPARLIDQVVDTRGVAIGDRELLRICYQALDRSSWNARVGGRRAEAWVQAGERIRAALTIEDGQIVKIDKHAVNRALAELSTDANSRAAKDSLLRPLGGTPAGQAWAFPDAMQKLNPEWEALMKPNLTEDVGGTVREQRAKLADLELRARVLHSGIRQNADKWAGMETQHAEMLANLDSRRRELGSAVRRLDQGLSPKQSAAAPSVHTVPTAEVARAAKEAEARAHTERVRAKLEDYNDDIEGLQRFSDAVFKTLADADALLRDKDFAGAARLLKQSEDGLKLWDKLYWKTFRAHEELSRDLRLDRSRLERLHPAGARGHWTSVYDRSRDTSMARR